MGLVMLNFYHKCNPVCHQTDWAVRDGRSVTIGIGSVYRQRRTKPRVHRIMWEPWRVILFTD